MTRSSVQSTHQPNEGDFAVPPNGKAAGFVLKFRNGFYLNTNKDGGEGNGTWAVADIQRSKVFPIPPKGAAQILCAEILPVLVHADGRVDFATEVNARNEGGAVEEETPNAGAVKTTDILTEKVRMSVSSHLKHLERNSVSISEVCIETMVCLGGGVYRGFWPEIPGCEKLILFTSPKTGAGLALPFSRLSAAAVRKQIRESDYKFEIESLGVASA